MAIPRKQALLRLHGLLPVVEEHLAKLAADPNSRHAKHWRKEVDGWLRQMEEVLPHVGKKTAAEWQSRIQTFRVTLQT
jgi:hypothetical protein